MSRVATDCRDSGRPVNILRWLTVLAGCKPNTGGARRKARSRKLKLLSLLPLLACCFGISSRLLGRDAETVYSGLTAHEWGTFTSIAGSDGQAVEWSPLTGSTELPSFVEHFRDPHFKLGLRGTVRMETPVLYFYSSKEETISVNVAFSKGVITEWYPHASRVEPPENLYGQRPQRASANGGIAWDSLMLNPNGRTQFPVGDRNNHYFAARMTSSTPVRVKTATGEQQEKFLFYRGVSLFSTPISATLDTEGKLRIKNQGGDQEIPTIILSHRRGLKVATPFGAVPQ